MLRRVQQYIRTHNLLAPNANVLVCVSGGADSVALLDVLLRAGYHCTIAHCNFHLRADESNRDEAFVRHLALQTNTPFFIRHFDTIQWAKQHAQSVEMAARFLRYQWFAQLATEQQCQAIAVAHHQNDQAETLILNLLRGAGLHGLGGMRPLSANPASTQSPPIIRPLLCTTHDYIVHYLRDIRRLSWVEDSTNDDTTIKRNNIRHWLKQCSKGEIENICRTANYMQGYADWHEHTDSLQSQLVQLYEQLKPYGIRNTEQLYQAIAKGESGKRFELPGATVIIHKHAYQIIPKE